MSQGRNITQATRKTRQKAVEKAVEAIQRETGESPWQIDRSRIIERIAGDSSFAACRSPVSRAKAVKKAFEAVYGRHKGVSRDSTKTTAGDDSLPRQPQSKDPSQKDQESRADTIITELRELGVSEEKITEVRMMMLHSLERENAELKKLYAKSREDAVAAWQAVAVERRQKEMLERKIKNYSANPILNSAKHLVVFGE